ncbi:hypothetical protein N307_12162, partial [Dryobates pubescens]
RQRPRGVPLGSQRLPGPSECKRRHLGGAPALGWALRGYRCVERDCIDALATCAAFRVWHRRWKASGTGAGALPCLCFAPFSCWKGTHVPPMGERGPSPPRGLLGQP